MEDLAPARALVYLGIEHVLVQRVVSELGKPTRRGEDRVHFGERRHGEPHPRVARARLCR